MPDLIDAYPDPPTPRRRRILILALLVIAILFGARTALSYVVDLLWFQSLGFGGVYWTTFGLEAGIFAAATLLTFLVLYGAFFLIRRSHAGDLPSARALVIGGRPVNLSVEPVLRFLSLGGSVVIAFLTGLTLMSEWPTFALFWHAPHATGSVTDPIFGKPLNFYLFTLPAWQVVNDWLLTLAFLTVAVAVLFLFITSGARSSQNRRIRYAPSPWRGLSLAVAFLLLVLAMKVYVDRFQLLLEHHTVFDGITYTDAHVRTPGLLLVCAALLLGAGIAAFNAFRESRARMLVVAILPAAACYVVLTVAGWYVDSFLVKPNELVREEPYIATTSRSPARPTASTASPAGVPRRNHRRRRRPRQQSAHAPEHPPLGLARAAGHPAPGAGDPHLLRLPRHRHRSLLARRRRARGHARRTRAQRRQAPRQQPQLDQ